MNLNLRCTAPVGAAAWLHQKIRGLAMYYTLLIINTLPSFIIIAYFDVMLCVDSQRRMGNIWLIMGFSTF